MSARLPLLKEHGVTHEWIDNQDGSFTVLSSQDVGPILERNKKMAAHNDGYTPSREMRRVASIPNIILMQWLAEAGGDMSALRDEKFLARKLNDGDYLYLRTAPGRV